MIALCVRRAFGSEWGIGAEAVIHHGVDHAGGHCEKLQVIPIRKVGLCLALTHRPGLDERICEKVLLRHNCAHFLGLVEFEIINSIEYCCHGHILFCLIFLKNIVLHGLTENVETEGWVSNWPDA